MNDESLLHQKVQRALVIPTDTPAMLAALTAIRDADARNLRPAMEADALQQALLLQKEWKELADKVKNLRSSLQTVREVTQKMMPQVDDQEADVAAQLGAAFAARDQAHEKYQIVQMLLEKWNVSPEDQRLLEHVDMMTASPTEVKAFLAALARVRELQQEQQSSTSTTSSMAWSMMERLAQQQERAYERLYHWMQSRLEDENAVDDDLLALAWQELAHQPALFLHASHLWATSRRSLITKAFLMVLTAGPAPLELSAHDPVKYASEMMAYCFQAFSQHADASLELSRMQKQRENDERVSSRSLLAQCTQGVARPLASRLTQVIATLAQRPDDDDDDITISSLQQDHDRLTQLYEICGLLLFYMAAMQKTLNKMKETLDKEEVAPNSLYHALGECLRDATRSLEAAVRVQSAQDQPASSVHATVDALRHVRHTSPGFGPDVECPADCATVLGLSWMTATLVEAALLQATSLDDVVLLQQSVKGEVDAKTTGRLLTMLQEQETKLVDALVEQQTQDVLELCGLAPLVSAYTQWKELNSDDTALTDFLSLNQAEAGMSDFYASLYAPPLPSLEHVKDVTLRKRVRQGICQRVCDVYESLYAALGDGASFLSHTPAQVRTLFSA